MRMTRFITSALLGLCLALGSITAMAFERPVAYVTAAVQDLQDPAMVRYHATLATWSADHGVSAAPALGGLRADSNHFVMSTVLPEPTLDS